jgi:hypothetical protein
VLYSPDFKLNLLSVAKLCNSLSCTVRFTPSNCLIQDLISKRTIGLGDQVDHLYHLQIDPAFFASQVKLPSVVNSVSSCSLHSQTIPNNALWHFRLGHVSHSRMSYMTQLYPSVSFDNKAVCDVCHFAKQKRLPFTLSTSIATSKFDLLHLDIWGPLAIPSVHGHRYFLTIVDDHTRFVWIILLKQKSEVAIKLQHFITLIENQYTTVPKIIRSDNGPEFSLSTFYSSLSTRDHVLRLLNRMVVLNVNTNIFSMLVVPYYIILSYPSLFGHMHYYMPHSSLIESLHQFLATCLHIKKFMINYLILIPLKFLGLYATLPLSMLIDPNLILELANLCF